MCSTFPLWQIWWLPISLAPVDPGSSNLPFPGARVVMEVLCVHGGAWIQEARGFLQRFCHYFVTTVLNWLVEKGVLLSIEYGPGSPVFQLSPTQLHFHFGGCLGGGRWEALADATYWWNPRWRRTQATGQSPNSLEHPPPKCKCVQTTPKASLTEKGEPAMCNCLASLSPSFVISTSRTRLTRFWALEFKMNNPSSKQVYLPFLLQKEGEKEKGRRRAWLLTMQSCG